MTDDELFEKTKVFVWSCLAAQNPSTGLIEQVARKVTRALPKREGLTSWDCPRCGKTVRPYDGSECLPTRDEVKP